MLTRRFAVHLNRSLVGLLGIVIEKTDVAYLRSFPCVVVKKTFGVTCGDPETEVNLILWRASIFETPKDIDDFTVPVLGGFVVPLVNVECLKKCSAMVKVGLSRFQKPIGELEACTTDSTQDVWKIHIANLNTKNRKIPKIRPPLPMCTRGSSQITKIVLVMLISGIVLSEKHPKRYQLGVW